MKRLSFLLAVILSFCFINTSMADHPRRMRTQQRLTRCHPRPMPHYRINNCYQRNYHNHRYQYRDYNRSWHRHHQMRHIRLPRRVYVYIEVPRHEHIRHHRR